MSAADHGGPAFPTEVVNTNYGYIHQGMTLRDYFAAKAMQGLLANPSVTPVEAFKTSMSGDIEKATTLFAYMVADKMLTARKGGAV